MSTISVEEDGLRQFGDAVSRMEGLLVQLLAAPVARMGAAVANRSDEGSSNGPLLLLPPALEKHIFVCHRSV